MFIYTFQCVGLHNLNGRDSGVMNWFLKFADDTKICGKVNTAFDGLKLQKDLQNFKWSVDWQMEFKLPYPERLRLLNLTKLEEWRSRGDLIETFKIMSSKDKVFHQQFFTLKNRWLAGLVTDQYKKAEKATSDNENVDAD